jgi:hypothetical protein
MPSSLRLLLRSQSELHFHACTTDFNSFDLSKLMSLRRTAYDKKHCSNKNPDDDQAGKSFFHV